MKDETATLAPSSVSFSQFKTIMTRNIMSFAKGKSWTNDDWNEEYTSFRVCTSGMNQEYLRGLTNLEIVTDWAKDFYCEVSKETHSYWLNIRTEGRA